MKKVAGSVAAAVATASDSRADSRVDSLVDSAVDVKENAVRTGNAGRVGRVGRGGARAGAGRPAGSGSGLSAKIQLCVTPSEKALYERLGSRKWLRSVLAERLEAEERWAAMNDRSEAGWRGVPVNDWNEPWARLVPFKPLPAFPTNVECGFPSPASDYAADEIDLNARLIAHPAATFVARASGYSMIDAGIDPGDYLLVDRALEARDGDIVLAWIDDEFTVKRLRLERGRPTFHPENAAGDYPVIEPGEFQDVKVYGVVTNIIKSLR